MAGLRAEHGDSRAAAYEASVVGGDLERATVAELRHLAGGARNFGREQRSLQQARAVLPQDSGLPLVGAEQNDDGALTGGLIPPPVGAERAAPHRNGALEPVLAGAAASQDDQAAHRAGRQLRAAGALLEQIDLALLSQRDAVDQLGNRAPGPEARRGEDLAEQGRVGHGPGQRDGGLSCGPGALDTPLGAFHSSSPSSSAPSSAASGSLSACKLARYSARLGPASRGWRRIPMLSKMRRRCEAARPKPSRLTGSPWLMRASWASSSHSVAAARRARLNWASESVSRPPMSPMWRVTRSR